MKLVGQIVVVLGAIVVIASLAANPLRIGNNPNEFGWLQALGAVIGFLSIAVGLWLAQRTR